MLSPLTYTLSHAIHHSERLCAVQSDAQKLLENHARTLDDLDDLGEVMTEMLERQGRIEVSPSHASDMLR